MSPLQHFRTIRGHSLRALALATRIDHVRLHHIEHGRRATDDELQRLARALACTVDELRGDLAPAVAS